MLVLSRKKDERIVIGDDIVVTIVEVAGQRVRLGVEAPREVRVMRGELLDQEPAQRQGASREELPLAFDPTWPCLPQQAETVAAPR